MENSSDISNDALNCYSIIVQSVVLIGHNASTVYKVTDKEDNCYSLRIHLSRNDEMENTWSERETINSEMIWLESLSNDTDLVLPSPVKNNKGEYTTVIAGVICTLVTWVEGEQKPIVLTTNEAGYVGEMIGKLHKQSSSWVVPSSFKRPTFDLTRILQAIEKLKLFANRDGINSNEMEIVQSAGDYAIAMMNGIERSPDNWGIIHADLIPSNFVFYGHEVRPIDFGACGFGYYLFDLGWTFSYIHPRFRSHLLEAYVKNFELPHNYVKQLECFIVAAQLETMNFWIGLPDSKEWLPGHISKLASREFNSYVKNENFLFSGTPYWE